VTLVTSTPIGGFRIDVRDKDGSQAALRLLVDAGVTTIRTSRPSLEEVYVHFIGERGLKV
jgi:ABC-2 type transport system ATP-binding protein